MLGKTVGLEIECERIVPLDCLNPITGWVAGYDGSFSNCVEYRFANPAQSLSEIDILLNRFFHSNNLSYLRSHKCAGIHVHIGTPDPIKNWLMYNFNHPFIQDLANKLLKFRRSSRREWCLDKMAIRKYSPINIVNVYPTIEFRVFNTVLNKRYVWKCIQWSSNVFDSLVDLYNVETKSSVKIILLP